MTDTPAIVPLTPASPHLETIVGWQQDAWGHLNPTLGFAGRCEEVRGECGQGGVPSVFVALIGNQPVGTASLTVDDMDTRPELAPWLASVFVLPEWRGRGIASRLARRVEEEAREAGIATLYLYTPDQQALYRRLGWEDREALHYRGEDVTVMLRRLAGAT